MAHAANRRKPRLVDRSFQLGLAWRMMIAFFAFFAGGLVIVFAPSIYLLATGSRLSELTSAADEFLVLHERVWPAALFVFAGVFLYTLYLSHRIAGPIYRINAVLRQMIDGVAPGKVILRRGDFFRSTADLLEELAQKAAGESVEEDGRENEPVGPSSR